MSLILLLTCVYNGYSQINLPKYLYTGHNYINDQEYHKAIRTFNIILSYLPDYAEAYFLRGYSKLKLSDYSGAIGDFTQAIEHDKYLTDAMYYMAMANIELSYYSKALQNLIMAVDIDDRHPHYYAARAYLHTEFGDTLGAIQDYESALKINPEYEAAQLRLSQIYFQKKEYDKSLEYLSKVLQKNPRNIDAILLKANISLNEEKYDEAKEQYYTVLEIDSNNARTYFSLAICHSETENIDSAYYYYNKTLGFNPDNAVCYYNRAILNIGEDKYNDAIKDINKVISLSPNNIYAYQLRGKVKMHMEDYISAEQDFSHVIELYPLMVDAYRDRAYARGVQNKIHGYEQDLLMADSLVALIEAGEVKTPGLDYYKAITDFRADFTNVSDASKNRIQYIEQSIRMLSIYHPMLVTKEQKIEEQDLANNYFNFKEIDIDLNIENFDYADLSDFQIAELKETIDNAIHDYPDSLKFEVLKSLVLGWQMEYSFANTILSQLPDNYPLNLVAYFIKANHNYFIGSVVASLDIRHFSLDKSEEISISANENQEAEGYYKKAVENYSKAIELEPNFIYSYYNRAYVNALLKNYKEAIRDYTHCINSDNENGFPEALYNRGLIYIYHNNYTRGCKDLSKAGELGIDNAYRVIYKYCKN